MILDYDGKGLTARPRLVQQVRAQLAGAQWEFARQQHEAIAADWQQRLQRKPQLFNGEVLMSQPPRFDDTAAALPLFTARYAELLYWQDHPPGSDGVRLPYAVPVPVTRDGGLVLGVMAAHTANAGMSYFPSGTLSGEDVAADGTVDLHRAMLREIVEECGFAPSLLCTAGDWLMLETARSLACFVPVCIALDDAQVLAAFTAHAARSPGHELDALRIVHARADLAGLELPIVQKRYFDLFFGGYLHLPLQQQGAAVDA